MFIFLFVFSLVYSLPVFNSTHDMQLYISVDDVPKGFITLALFKNEAPKSVTSLIDGCNCVRKKRCKQASFKEMYQGLHMGFNFKTNTSETWRSEVNEYHTEFGALGQQRDVDQGTVGPNYKIFLRRMDFDGPRSQWLVIGAIKKVEDKKLIEYLDWTGSNIYGDAKRNITFTDCKIIKNIKDESL